jgi:hypothetical protein
MTTASPYATDSGQTAPCCTASLAGSATSGSARRSLRPPVVPGRFSWPAAPSALLANLRYGRMASMWPLLRSSRRCPGSRRPRLKRLRASPMSYATCSPTWPQLGAGRLRGSRHRPRSYWRPACKNVRSAASRSADAQDTPRLTGRVRQRCWKCQMTRAGRPPAARAAAGG